MKNSMNQRFQPYIFDGRLSVEDNYFVVPVSPNFCAKSPQRALLISSFDFEPLNAFRWSRPPEKLTEREIIIFQQDWINAKPWNASIANDENWKGKLLAVFIVVVTFFVKYMHIGESAWEALFWWSLSLDNQRLPHVHYWREATEMNNVESPAWAALRLIVAVHLRSWGM